jgi:hypothetical protein
MLNDKVIPWYEEHGVALLRTLTDRGSKYCGNREHHEFELYLGLEDIEHTDVDEWLKFYNEERTHSGKHCFGKTPWQTFVDSKELATQKQLDRTYQTTEPIAAAS